MNRKKLLIIFTSLFFPCLAASLFLLFINTKNNIEILGGTYKSTGGTVQYDYMDAFLIAENKISLEYADIDKDIRDGLEIKGGLVALGRDLSNTPAVEIKRNLRLYNYSYPTLVITIDPKYADISKTFFGTEAPMYKQEVGFKGL